MIDQSRSTDRADRLLAGLLTSNTEASDRSLLIEAVRHSDPLISSIRLNELVERAWQRANGLGPIAELLADPEVTEVMINGPGPVWIDRGDSLQMTTVVLGLQDLELLVERIVDPLGLRVDRVSPMVDARLADGSRVNVVVPPLAVDGPIITIRRFATRPLALSAFGPPALVELLGELMRARRTLVVSGGTGAGKTTLLNSLGCLIDEGERIVVIEDTSELRLPGRHLVRMETRPANSEGVGAVTLRDLVRNALRMRPDRIVVGEVRGGEAFDLLLALNTGHRGTLTTCHANGPAAALDRLFTLALLGGVNLPSRAIKMQLLSAIDVIVQVERSPSGRRVTEVAEIVGSSLQTRWSA